MSKNMALYFVLAIAASVIASVIADRLINGEHVKP